MNGEKDKIKKNLLITIISLVAISFMGVVSETSLNIAYPALMNQFQVSASTIQWLTTGYLLVLSISIPISPFLVKKFPTKRLLQAAVLTFFVGTLAGACAPNFSVLLLGRLVMAVGTGISLPLLTNIVLEKAPFQQRGFLLGLVVMVTTVAPTVGPIFGGIVMEYLNWHWLFLFLLPLILFSLIAGSLTVKDIRKGEKPVIDLLSVFLSVIALSGIVLAFSISGDWGWDYRTWIILIIGVGCLLPFVWRQLRLEVPLIQVRVFRYRRSQRESA
ncbi:MFS transporter [Caproicibacterium sp. BJN0003]|uniref:MFS transporter n=1 Tax=Caproicibacterium sp. BJN0003 TaxID=2994078 RepID=UPI002258340D|nr:MFS transporter [Caproicibacterium sp. BJN0003]UZT81597.1 MFS transporter [Caproicibacterium sp. BJN0003]